MQRSTVLAAALAAACAALFVACGTPGGGRSAPSAKSKGRGTIVFAAEVRDRHVYITGHTTVPPGTALTVGIEGGAERPDGTFEVEKAVRVKAGEDGHFASGPLGPVPPGRYQASAFCGVGDTFVLSNLTVRVP